MRVTPPINFNSCALRPAPCALRLIHVLDLFLHRRLLRQTLRLQQRSLHRQQRLQARLPRGDHVLVEGGKSLENDRENMGSTGHGWKWAILMGVFSMGKDPISNNLLIMCICFLYFSLRS